MKRPTDWLGGAAPLNEYRCLNREERHITATLYSLMLTDRVGLRVLLEEVCGVPCAHGEAEEAAVWFEFTFLRDWWKALEGEEHKRSALRHLLGAVEPGTADADPSAVTEGIARLHDTPLPELNSLFSTRPSRTTLESPARWSTDVILHSLRACPDLTRRAILLSWSFRIKPDVVVTIGSDCAVIFEAKWDSPEDRYRCPAIDLNRRQVQLQRDMFTRLLGLRPDRVYSVMLAKRRKTQRSRSAERIVSWPEAFGCFAESTAPTVLAVLPDAAVARDA